MLKNWQSQTLENLATVERGRFSARPRNDRRYYGGSTPFIQTGDVSSANGLLRSWSQTLNTEGVAVSKVFPSGTIFITIAANIGDTAISTFDAACPDSVVAVRPRSNVDRDWLYQALRFKKKLLDSFATQNAQKNINLEVLRPLRFDTPLLAEQLRIAEILRSWDDAIEKTNRLITAMEERFGAFSVALLRGHRRFSEDDSTWSNVSFNDVVQELVDRNSGRLSADAVMGVNRTHGMIPMKEHVRAEDLSRYKSYRRTRLRTIRCALISGHSQLTCMGARC
jgi:type I restriction enzyme S subunit